MMKKAATHFSRTKVGSASGLTTFVVLRSFAGQGSRFIAVYLVALTVGATAALAQDVGDDLSLMPSANRPRAIQEADATSIAVDAAATSEVMTFSRDPVPPVGENIATGGNVPEPIVTAGPVSTDEFTELLSKQAEEFLKRENTGSTVKTVLLLGALSLAPALLLMTTSYIRVFVVLSLLRQAFGGQALPPNQVLTALSLFITLLVMAPVWQEVKREAIDPYANEQSIDWDEAWARGVVPVKQFMSRQIEVAQNQDAIDVFYKYVPQHAEGPVPSSMDQVPIQVLLPAFVLSELKVAFLLGFQVFLPFLVLDLVVSSVTVSMGMLMLPPTMVSFPLKLILFVLVDGWNLVVGMLLQSFALT